MSTAWMLPATGCRGMQTEISTAYHLEMKRPSAVPPEAVAAELRKAEDAAPTPQPGPAAAELAQLEKLVAGLQAEMRASVNGLENADALRQIAARQEAVVLAMDALENKVGAAQAASEAEQLHEAFTRELPNLAGRIQATAKALSELDHTAAGFAKKAADLERQQAELQRRKEEAEAALRQLAPRVIQARRARDQAAADAQAAIAAAVREYLHKRCVELRAKVAGLIGPTLDELAAAEAALARVPAGAARPPAVQTAPPARVAAVPFEELAATE